MKKLFALFIVLVLAACNSQKKYSDFDYSFEKSGGIKPAYENFLIKGNNGYYSLEGNGKNIKKDFKVSDEEIASLEKALTENRFRRIHEDYKKMYDHISVNIKVKKGNNSGNKSDASQIMKNDQQRWNAIVKTFRTLINAKVNDNAETHQ